MTNFDRKQFKATSVAELKKLKTADDTIVGTSGNRDFISIEKGTNKIRLAPKFPDEKDFYLMRMVHWGSIENKDGDLKRIPILNSKIHGGTKLDIFESYLEFASKKMANKPDMLKTLTDYKTGLSASTTWWALGWSIKKDQKPKFGIFEFKKTVRDSINSLCIIEDEEEAIEVDPFTDIDSGKPIIVTYNPDEKEAKNYYKVQLAKNEFPLTDEMFEELCSKESLTKQMRGVYSLKDFEKACEAIRNFDIEKEFDLFDDADFQETVSLIASQYTSNSEEKTSSKSETKKSTKKVVVEDEDEEEEAPKAKKKESDKFDKMDREELKDYIAEEEYEIGVKKAESDDDIRNKIRNYELTLKPTSDKNKKVSEEDDEDLEDEEEEAPKAKKKEKEEIQEKTPKLTIEQLREKLKQNSKK